MENKKRIVSLLLFSLLFVAIILIGTWKIQSIFSPLKVKDSPSAAENKEAMPVQEQSQEREKKRHIRPIVIEDKLFNRKPDSLDPAEWDEYNRKKLEIMRSEMGPELIEKLQAEFTERDNPQIDENLVKFDEAVEKFKEKVEKNPTDLEGREMLQKLLNIQSKNKFLREMLINKQP
ncbi:MAG: hypothetical protein JW867_06025 [Candidatus Omnitrophica bacterium]|nr:hypothetical protein [Candidatus Omnitrophota bacterium]